MGREYYSKRKGILQPTPIDLPLLKKVFLSIYRELDDKFYFRGATGYDCVDEGHYVGTWDMDIEAFIYRTLRMRDIWPIQENIKNYDEPTLFTVIEFLHDYVSEPQQKSYHGWDDCGWHTWDYDKEKGQKEYREKINEILKDYDKRYQLTKDGEIQIVPPTGLETIVEQIVKTEDSENIDRRIRNAVSKYHKYNATTEDKKEAIRTLADVLEFLKKEDIKLSEKDDKDLFNIINGFDIRHHNRFQKGEYDKDLWYDWMFYTFLASINLLLRLEVEKKGSIV